MSQTYLESFKGLSPGGLISNINIHQKSNNVEISSISVFQNDDSKHKFQAIVLFEKKILLSPNGGVPKIVKTPPIKME